jgi:hypothetical protein
MAIRICRQASLQYPQAKRTIANTARNPNLITNPRTAPMQSLPWRHGPDNG